VKVAKEPKGLKFEVALEELETIVGEMENAELPLERLIERYEEGMRLVKICGDKLSEAEQKVEILTQKAPALPTTQESDEDAETETDDEAKLF
jgi:exodeoxyribonuclease VII small subunit